MNWKKFLIGEYKNKTWEVDKKDGAHVTTKISYKVGLLPILSVGFVIWLIWFLFFK